MFYGLDVPTPLPRGVRKVPETNPPKYQWRFQLNGRNHTSKGSWATSAEAAQALAAARSYQLYIEEHRGDHVEDNDSEDLAPKSGTQLITHQPFSMAVPEPPGYTAFRAWWASLGRGPTPEWVMVARLPSYDAWVADGATGRIPDWAAAHGLSEYADCLPFIPRLR